MTTDRPTASLSLGLDIEGHEMRAVLIKVGKGHLSLDETLIIHVEQDESHHVKPLYTSKNEKRFNALISKSLIVTGLPASVVMVRSLSVQLIKEKDIDQVLEFQSEPLLPFPIDEAVVDRIITGKGLDHTELAICAVKKSLLSEHINHWHEAGVEPEVISCSQSALSLFSKRFSSIEGLHYILHLGADETICLLVNEGVLLNAQTARIGTGELHKAFFSDTDLKESSVEQAFKDCDFSAVTSQSHPKLYQKTEQLKVEIAKRLLSLAKQFPGQEIDHIFCTGAGAALNNLPEEINKQLNKTLHFPKPLKGFDLTPFELRKLAIPLGLALQAVPKAKNQINFRQKEFAYPYPWKRLKKPIAIYLALCFILTGAILAFGKAYITTKEDDLRQKYLDILTLMNKTFVNTEIEVKKKNPYTKTFEDEMGSPVMEMSQADIAKRLSLLEKEVDETPDTFPLLPNTPKVSDFLGWLSNHPHIISSEGGPKDKKIVLESLSYKMVKRPDINKKKEKYQVKVELEFSTSTPRYAREFHDILLAPNEMVDPNEDVKWNAERGRYRASFFLKDRTIYPAERRK